ncbi:MAG: TetR/AcrR family transcriptional regulator [Bifidobacteriaceae bacterium]|jgi:AcrR family transcriptional regulator|nr:TetR/AcrR family transcriptional regulator [Bifidobacteriaceae bacterium]
MTSHREGPLRSEAARLAILQATARQFAAQGYDQVTIEGVAAEARVGKQTIYRWWDSKSALVAEALLDGLIAPAVWTPPDTGDIRADLEAWLAAVFALLAEPGNASFARSIVAAAVENEQVGRHIHDALGTGNLFQARLEKAVADGQIDPGRPLREMTEALAGFLVLHTLERAENSSDLPRRAVAAILP